MEDDSNKICKYIAKKVKKIKNLNLYCNVFFAAIAIVFLIQIFLNYTNKSFLNWQL